MFVHDFPDEQFAGCKWWQRNGCGHDERGMQLERIERCVVGDDHERRDGKWFGKCRIYRRVQYDYAVAVRHFNDRG